MFNRFITATRSVFSFRADRQLEFPDRSSSQQHGHTPPVPVDMVTTRSQAEHSDPANDLENDGRKRKRAKEEEAAQPPRKKKPSGAAENANNGRSRVSKSPSSTLKKNLTKKQKLPVRSHRSSRLDTGADPGQKAEHEPPASDASISDRSNKSDLPSSPVPRESPEIDQHGPVNGNAPTTDETQASKHVRFDSEESLPSPNRLTSQQPSNQEDGRKTEVPEDVSSDDDDDAPEAVTTAQSQANARASAVGASKAIQRYESSNCT